MADGELIHNYIRMGKTPILEFILPKKIAQDGQIQWTFSCGQEDEGEGERGTPLAEIGLIKKLIK